MRFREGEYMIRVGLQTIAVRLAFCCFLINKTPPCNMKKTKNEETKTKKESSIFISLVFCADIVMSLVIPQRRVRKQEEILGTVIILSSLQTCLW